MPLKPTADNKAFILPKSITVYDKKAELGLHVYCLTFLSRYVVENMRRRN